MKNKWILLIVLILLIGLGIFLIKDSKIGDNSSGGSDSDKVQEITLSIKNGNYYPQTLRVKVNEPVRIYLDDSVVGCYRAFTIRELGLGKYIENSSDYIEFTPTQKGTFSFACSMGMGTGTFVVE